MKGSDAEIIVVMGDGSVSISAPSRPWGNRGREALEQVTGEGGEHVMIIIKSQAHALALIAAMRSDGLAVKVYGRTEDDKR